MVNFTCPHCRSRQQIDSLLNYEAVTCGNCQQQVLWNEVVDLIGEVLCNCTHCGAKLRINQSTLEGNGECCMCRRSFLIRSAPNLVGPGIQPSQQASTAALTYRQESTAVDKHLGQIDASLKRLVNGLIAKDFKFITPEVTPQQMHERIAKFDEDRAGLTGKLFSFLIGGSDMPDVAKMITKHIVAFGADDVDDAELATLQQHMRSCFPLCAITFSKIYGPRFVAIVDGDSSTQSELFAAMDRFQEINLCIMPLGGRLSIKLFGKSIVGINASAATGSMIIVASTTQRANLLRQWISSKPLHSDTIINQMKERFSRWQFWAKAVVGMIEYKPHQLRQEAIVLDAQTGQVTSTVSPRLGFEFGFVLTDIAGA